MPHRKRCFKLRLSRVIPSFNICRPKNPSTLPINPSPPFPHPAPVNGQPTLARRSSVSSAITSVVCGCRSSSENDPDDYAWRRDDTWHVVAKVSGYYNYCSRADESPPRRKIYTSAASGCDSDTDDDLTATPPRKMKLGSRRGKKVAGAAGVVKKEHLRVSTSSIDSCALFFSTDDGEETEQLISSSLTTHSTDETSSERQEPRFPSTLQKQSIEKHSHSHSHNHRRQKNRARNERVKKQSIRLRESGLEASAARLSVFERLMGCRVEGKKVRESLAVVKTSDDPHGDFKRSMMEMIMEKEIFDEAELQQLLECFLSLNSKHYYPAIVRAFSEVWETLFCKQNQLEDY